MEGCASEPEGPQDGAVRVSAGATEGRTGGVQRGPAAPTEWGLELAFSKSGPLPPPQRTIYWETPDHSNDTSIISRFLM